MSSSTVHNNSNNAITQALFEVNDRIANVKKSDQNVRLVAVSKTKPVEMLMECYNAGQRRFGENYAQELMEKADIMPKDIEWHFIGPLQSNKAAPLVKQVKTGLTVVETVSTLKLANKLDRAVKEMLSMLDSDDESSYKLGIYVQVNTSGEESKSGVEPTEVVPLVLDIIEQCSHLSFQGLMTIGAPGDLTCFDKLAACRQEVAKKLNINETTLELSMGMSGDYEQAIEQGATNVRVGSTIFGARDYSNKA